MHEDRALAGPQQGKPQDLQNIFEGSTTESEPVLEYIQDLDARLRIFEELNRQPAEAWDSPIVAVFGVVMVAPITRLEDILHQVQRLAEANDKLAISCVFGAFQCFAEDGIEAFANKGGYEFRSTSSSTDDSPVPSPGLGADYIFPLQAVNHSYFSRLQGMLKTLWSNVWYIMMEETNILESPQNVIRLDPKLHWYYNNGEMALKPLRKTNDGAVVVQFHWLKRHDFEPSASLRSADMDEWMQRAGLADNSSWGNNISGLPIETGQTFVLRAEDPAHVPSFELLQLSWDLRRIMAISGVANLEDLSDYSGDDGDIYHEGESSIGDEDFYAKLRSWVEGIQTDDESSD